MGGVYPSQPRRGQKFSEVAEPQIRVLVLTFFPEEPHLHTWVSLIVVSERCDGSAGPRDISQKRLCPRREGRTANIDQVHLRVDGVLASPPSPGPPKLDFEDKLGEK